MPDPRASRPHMPGYGISGPSGGRGLLPWSWAESKLAGAYRYWVVSAYADAHPHAMPVWAVWLDGALWFSTGGRSRKARNLRANPACVIHTDDEDPVVLDGVAHIVADPGQREAMIAAYGDKYPTPPPDPEENPIVRVRPRWVFGLVQDDFSGSPTKWTFDDQP